MSSELRGAKNVPLQLHVHHNFLEFPGDHKSLLGRSTNTLVLIQHQQQMTLQMNIWGPYWADFPISSQCRRPHVEGAGDSQLTKQNGTGEIKKQHKILYSATVGAGDPAWLKGVVIKVAERR